MFKNKFDKCPLKEVTFGRDERNPGRVRNIAQMTCPRTDDLDTGPQLSNVTANNTNPEARRKALDVLSTKVCQTLCDFCDYQKEGAKDIIDVANIRAQASELKVEAMRIEREVLQLEMQAANALEATRTEHRQTMGFPTTE